MLKLYSEELAVETGSLISQKATVEDHTANHSSARQAAQGAGV